MSDITVRIEVVRVRVLADAGRIIPRFGSFEKGSEVDLPRCIAELYLRQYPQDFELVEKELAEEVKDA